MPVSVIADLASRKLNPPIDREHTQALIDQLKTRIPLEQIETIYFSPSERCQATTYLIKEVLDKKDVNIQVLEDLQEVSFDLAKLLEVNDISESEFDIGTLNRMVLQGMADGVGVDQVEQMYQKIDQAFQIIKQSEHTNILCITHDFIMRVIELYIRTKGDISKLEPSDLHNTQTNGYLSGFVVGDQLRGFREIK